MEEGDPPGLGGDEKYRHTIGNGHGQQEPGCRGQMTIDPHPRMSPRGERPMHRHPGLVNLMGVDDTRESWDFKESVPRTRRGAGGRRPRRHRQAKVLHPTVQILADRGAGKEPREGVAPVMTDVWKGHGGVKKKL
jgi:hypothetical protein